MTVAVFFDYTCGYSNRARHWLDALEDAEIDWRPFSLLEQNSRDDGTPVFEQAQYADNPSLIALAVHEQVRAQGGDLHAYRRRMFAAWHEEPGRLSTQDIVDLGRDAGLRDFGRDAGFAALAAQHAEAAKLGVFGTPTLALGRRPGTAAVGGGQSAGCQRAGPAGVAAGDPAQRDRLMAAGFGLAVLVNLVQLVLRLLRLLAGVAGAAAGTAQRPQPRSDHLAVRRPPDRPACAPAGSAAAAAPMAGCAAAAC